MQTEREVLEASYEKLGTIIRQMDELVNKLGGYSEQLSNLAELNNTSPIPFVTWSYKDFSEVAKEVHGSYKKETEIKTKIAHSAYGCTLDQFNFLLIGWTHLVYCISDTKFEAMLYECGLK